MSGAPVLPRPVIEAMRGRKMSRWERVKHWWATRRWHRWSTTYQLEQWEREAHRLMGLDPDRPEDGVRLMLRGYVQAMDEEIEHLRAAIGKHRETKAARAWKPKQLPPVSFGDDADRELWEATS